MNLYLTKKSIYDFTRITLFVVATVAAVNTVNCGSTMNENHWRCQLWGGGACASLDFQVVFVKFECKTFSHLDI